MILTSKTIRAADANPGRLLYSLIGIYLIVFWQAATCVYHGARTAWILAYDRPAAAPSA